MIQRRTLLAGLMLGCSVKALAAEQPGFDYVRRIAFGSSLNPASHNQGIWDAVMRYRPHVMIFAGDSTYGAIADDKNPSEEQIIDALRDSYEKFSAIPNLERLKSRTKTFAIWDGHDYGQRDGGADFKARQSSKALFLSHWKVADDDLRNSHDGLYTAEILGTEGRRVQVIMLDTRFFRAQFKKSLGSDGKERFISDFDTSKTLLGPEQWQWLEEELKRPAELRLIVSPLQILHHSAGRAAWGLLPHERNRLFGLIKTTAAKGVVLLSGHRRFGAFYKDSGKTPYPLVEFTSSGLTQSAFNLDEQGPNQIGAIFADLNFGTIDIDWWAKNLTLCLRGSNGESVRSLSISFSELGY